MTTPTIIRNSPTPWGPAQSAEDIGRGIIAVTTASHGGLFVPDELLHHIPERARRWAAQWSRSPNWYEEDCCWAAVALAFPELFKAEDLDQARRTLAANSSYRTTYATREPATPRGWDHG
jgi:hypothetical protein